MARGRVSKHELAIQAEIETLDREMAVKAEARSLLTEEIVALDNKRSVLRSVIERASKMDDKDGKVANDE